MLAVVATATAGACRDLPRRRRGSERRESTWWIPAREQKNAPSRSRRRPVHPIDLRRSDCRAGEPSTFGAPCSVQSESYPAFHGTSTHDQGVLAQIATFMFTTPLEGDVARIRASIRPGNYRSTQKCTEIVSPPSGLPTDRRRSDCRSEGHQPRALRPRCNWETTGCRRLRQGVRQLKCRSLRLFLYKPHILALSRVCST